MNRTLITGATGLVGFNTAQELIRQGRRLRATVRNVEVARQILPKEIELVEADLCDRDSLEAAMEDCEHVFHCAGLPEQWLKDDALFQEVNVGGTRNICSVALAHQVKSFVYTSTIDVFEAKKGQEFDESIIDANEKGTCYERSKQEADRVVVAALAQGLPAIFVHPAAVYGPGPSASPGLNQFFADLRDRNIPGLLPGGMPIVYGPDLGRGQVLAERAIAGSRFILSDRYFSLQQLAELVAKICPSAKIPMTLPTWGARMLSGGGEVLAKLTGKAPLIPKGQLHFLLWQARPLSGKARRELGWTLTPAAEALAETMRSLAS